MAKDIGRNVLVKISEESYFDLLSVGSRSGYIRLAANERLARVRAALSLLRTSRNSEEILELLADGDTPSAMFSETELVTLRPSLMKAISLLWAEGEATGLEGHALLDAIEGGRCA